MNNDKIELQLETLTTSKIKKIDGIVMSNCILVDLFINEVSVLGDEFYEDGLVVFDELRKSVETSGDFLIFTCACGVADDGGWEMTNVQHEKAAVKWTVARGDEEKKYVFESASYVEQIRTMAKEIELLQKKGLALEPRNPIPPESDI